MSSMYVVRAQQAKFEKSLTCKTWMWMWICLGSGSAVPTPFCFQNMERRPHQKETFQVILNNGQILRGLLSKMSRTLVQYSTICTDWWQSIVNRLQVVASENNILTGGTASGP